SGFDSGDFGAAAVSAANPQGMACAHASVATSMSKSEPFEDFIGERGMHGSADGRADTKLTWRGRNPNRPPGILVGHFFEGGRREPRIALPPCSCKSKKDEQGPLVTAELG